VPVSISRMSQIKRITIPILSLGVLFFSHFAGASTLAISPASKTVEVGETLDVEVILDTKGEGIDAVDLFALRYDAKVLEVIDANPAVSGVQISPGSILPLTIVNTVDTTAGSIVFSQAVMGGTSYNGKGKLASVSFRAKAKGTAKVAFDFRSGSTTDTNVAARGADDQGRDSLTSVSNASFTVKESSNPGATPPPAQPPGAPPEDDPGDPPGDGGTQPPPQDIGNPEAGDDKRGSSQTKTLVFVVLGLAAAGIIAASIKLLRK
jgi:hypothetical protein